MSEGIEKVICCEKGGSDTALMSMLSNNGSWQNNPFLYLIFLAMFGRNGLWGNNNGAAVAGENFNSRQIAELQNSVNTNHNNDLAMQAIQGNSRAISELAQSFNCSSNTMQLAVSNVRSSIEQLSGQVGMTSERVINSVLLGNKDLLQTLQSCCCENKMLVTNMGYQSQLGQKDLQNSITSRIDQLANGITQGFSSVGYANSQNTNAIMQNTNAMGQRIVDTLNNHWNSELQLKYQDAKNELSQSAQTNALTLQLNAIAAAIAKIPTT